MGVCVRVYLFLCERELECMHKQVRESDCLYESERER